MSVWTDMGFFSNGELFGVDPEVFFRTTLEFWRTLKRKCYPGWVFPAPPEDHFIAKGRTLDWYWNELTFWGFSAADGLEGYTHPVPENYWNTSPDWLTILAMDQEAVLGETIYPRYLSLRLCDIMNPRLAKQRRELIKLTRYAVIPLDGGGRCYGEIHFGNGPREVKELSYSIPEYWAQGTTKIGICGESGKPVSGNFWTTGSYYFKYTGEQSVSQQLYIFGAVDLATHPDFSQYFDIA